MSNPLTQAETARLSAAGFWAEERERRILSLVDECDALAAQLSEMGRQRDLAIQQAIDEETKHRKWTDDRELLAKDLAAARAELDDYRKAWALLDEPGAELRHAHTAEEAARQFVAKIGAARAELAAARMALSPIGVTEGALPGLIEHLRAELAKMTAFADKECAARMDAQVELAKVKAELDVFATVDEQRRAAIERFVEERNEARATAAQHEKALEATRVRIAMLSDEQRLTDADVSAALAAHDAQVEAKALARAAKWMNDNGYIVPQPDDTEEDAGKVMLRDLAGKDGTTP